MDDRFSFHVVDQLSRWDRCAEERAQLVRMVATCVDMGRWDSTVCSIGSMGQCMKGRLESRVGPHRRAEAAKPGRVHEMDVEPSTNDVGVLGNSGGLSLCG